MTWLNTAQPYRAFSFACLFLVMLSLVDYLSGYELNFFIFYYVPIILCAWFVNRQAALLMTVVAALAWFVVDRLTGHPYSSAIFWIWNGLIRLVAFIIVAEAFSAVRRERDKEREISDVLGVALNKVKKLSGLLPICCSCKNIRNDKGYWQQIEDYIAAHSEAEFTHGICPDCAKRLLGELRTNKEKVEAKSADANKP